MTDPRHNRPHQVLSAPGPLLAALAERARRLAEVESQVAGTLPPELLPHCTVASYQHGRLTLAADTASWATRLRYHTGEIRRNLEAAGMPVSDCRIILQQAAETPPPAPRDTLTLSPAAAAVLESTASGIGHQPLAAALRRLAGHAKR